MKSIILSALLILASASSCPSPQEPTPTAPKTRRVLALDSGGTLGLVEAILLDKIEQATGKPIAEQFDLIGGVSTGGIIGIGLSIKGISGHPKISAADMVKFYKVKGPIIFDPNDYNKPSNGKCGIHSCFLDGKKLTDTIHQAFGDARIKDSLTAVFVTANRADKKLEYLTSWQAKANPSTLDAPSWEIARVGATIATIFEMMPLNFSGGPVDGYYDGDGEGHSGNPARYTLDVAKQLFPGDPIEVFSIGSASPAVLLALGIKKAEADKTPLPEDIEAIVKKGAAAYFRANPNLEVTDLNNIADASAKFYEYLEKATLKYVDDPEFKQLVDALKKPR